MNFGSKHHLLSRDYRGKRCAKNHHELHISDRFYLGTFVAHGFDRGTEKLLMKEQ